MKKCIFVCVCLLVAVTPSFAQKSITTVVLVRHAEKADDGTKDPPLLPEGSERAERLRLLLSKMNIDAIYSTAYKRTRQTVQPLAAAKNISLQTYEAFSAEEIERILRAHHGGTIVICGHSNNSPWTANLLLGNEQFKDYTENEYENVLIVSVAEKGKVASVTRLVF
jgi:broad specificity phosphatase PhoE